MNSPARRPRVLQVITRLGLGGAEKVALSLVQGLRGEIDSGVFTVYRGCRDEVGAGMRRDLAAAAVLWFPGTRLPVKCGGMLSGAFALSRAVHAFRPDVIHYHAEVAESVGATLAAISPAFSRLPSLRTIHNSLFWHYWPRIGRWCDRRLVGARIACVSMASCEAFLRYRDGSGACPPEPPPVVIYNGVAAGSMVTPSAPRGRPVQLLFAGRLDPQKGVDVLCAALPKVALPTGWSGRLVVIGHGVEEPLVRALSAHPPLGWTIEVRAPVADLRPVLPEFDLVVMPSRFEGLGLVAVEAILRGLPVVATDIPGLREVVPSGYPWLARPGDPDDLAAVLGHALHDHERWAGVTDEARRFALGRFCLETMLDSYRSLFAAVLRKGRSP